jgi:hypothetical protein
MNAKNNIRRSEEHRNAFHTLGGVPQGRDRRLVLVEGESETVDLVLVLHEQEGVRVDVTEELNSGP